MCVHNKVKENKTLAFGVFYVYMCVYERLEIFFCMIVVISSGNEMIGWGGCGIII